MSTAPIEALESLESEVDEVKPATKKIELGKTKFSMLMSVFSILSKHCDSVAIINGIIRQPTKRGTIFEVDVSSLVGTNDLYLNNIQTKEKLLMPFSNQQVDMTVEIDDREYHFYDTISKMTFKKPLPSHLPNKPISDEKLTEYESTKVQTLKSFTLDRNTLSRVNNTIAALGTENISIVCEGTTVRFIVRDKTNSKSTTGEIFTLSDLPMEVNGNMLGDIAAFTTNKVDSYDATFWSTRNNGYALEFKTFIDNEQKIPMRIIQKIAISDEE